MKARLARRIFGLPMMADRSEVERAHARLHAHVLARHRRAEGRPLTAEELERLGEARDSLVRFRKRAGIGVAVVSGAVLLGFLVWLSATLLQGGGGEGEGSGAGIAVGEAPAFLVAPGGVEGAELSVVDAATGESLLEVAADGSIHGLDPGAVLARVQHPDCGEAWEETVELESGVRHELDADPCPETGWLVVETGDPSDRVEIDGERVGEAGSERRPLPTGSHDLKVERDGHEAWEGRIEIDANETLSLRADPRPAVAKRSETRKSSEAKVAAARPPRAAVDPVGEDLPSRQWHQRTRQWLLSLYDHDRSDLLDTEAEVRAVPCRTWAGLAESVSKQRLALPLTRLYGFDGDGFVDGALGVSARVRDVAYQRMRECGLD